MRLVYMAIKNFRGIKEGKIYFNGNTVLVGDNNTGKSTVLEAIDLVLGPERISRHPVIDEHDFYAGQYLNADGDTVDINVEVIIADLNEEQRVHFRNHIEWWSSTTNSLIGSPPPEQTDEEGVLPALRLHFRGYYDKEEDDFVGETSFSSPRLDNGGYDRFGTTDKRKCGFLYLRTLRTGSRALSLEHGSLLDIILRIKELRPQMWEGILQQLYTVSLANDPEFGISEILTSVQSAVRELVPIECADAPQIRVSLMTREHLRQILTVFLETGAFKDDGSTYAAPYHHQGTGTINTLV
ncbi:MAG: ATP-binding protein, partial [Clostridiaceae bacterium]|nr:ATP-binding protein [Clostridiaceae bacterium]